MHRKVILEWKSEFKTLKGRNSLLNYMEFFPILLNLEGLQFCCRKLWLKLAPSAPTALLNINGLTEGIGAHLLEFTLLEFTLLWGPLP